MKRKKIEGWLRKLVYQIYGKMCVECSESERKLLQIHHIDENPSNNELVNLELLCFWCHVSRHVNNADKMIEWGIMRGIID